MPTRLELELILSPARIKNGLEMLIPGTTWDVISGERLEKSNGFPYGVKLGLKCRPIPMRDEFGSLYLFCRKPLGSDAGVFEWHAMLIKGETDSSVLAIEMMFAQYRKREQTYAEAIKVILDAVKLLGYLTP